VLLRNKRGEAKNRGNREGRRAAGDNLSGLMHGSDPESPRERRGITMTLRD
jgi:hypothetical protein